MPETATGPLSHDACISLESSSTYGRFISSHSSGSFVTDSKASNGGPGIAVNAAELLLSALASCALGLVYKKATELGISPTHASVKGYCKRSEDDGSRYDFITLLFQIKGVHADEAQELVDSFVTHCPIYNTLLRGDSNITARLSD